MVTQLARHALLIAVLCPADVLAQSSGSGLERVLECADVEREILRLECYDEAAAAIRSEAEAVEASPSDTRSSGSAAAEVGSRGAGDDRRAAEGAARSGRAADEAPRASPPPVATERGVESAPAQDADRDGDEDGKVERQVTIVEVRTPVPGRAVFVTSDGEEFVQTSGGIRLFLPDLPFQANVRPGAIGGLFLTPEGTRRSIRIATRD